MSAQEHGHGHGHSHDHSHEGGEDCDKCHPPKKPKRSSHLSGVSSVGVSFEVMCTCMSYIYTNNHLCVHVRIVYHGRSDVVELSG